MVFLAIFRLYGLWKTYSLYEISEIWSFWIYGPFLLVPTWTIYPEPSVLPLADRGQARRVRDHLRFIAVTGFRGAQPWSIIILGNLFSALWMRGVCPTSSIHPTRTIIISRARGTNPFSLLGLSAKVCNASRGARASWVNLASPVTFSDSSSIN